MFLPAIRKSENIYPMWLSFYAMYAVVLLSPLMGFYLFLLPYITATLIFLYYVKKFSREDSDIIFFYDGARDLFIPRGNEYFLILFNRLIRTLVMSFIFYLLYVEVYFQTGFINGWISFFVGGLAAYFIGAFAFQVMLSDIIFQVFCCPAINPERIKIYNNNGS